MGIKYAKHWPLVIALSAMPIASFAEIINVTGTAKIYSVSDKNENVLEWSDGIYEKGAMATFSMRLDTDNIKGLRFINKAAEFIRPDKGEVLPYFSWPVKTLGSAGGTDAKVGVYGTPFSSMTITLPEVITAEKVYPAKTFVHRSLPNPSSSWFKETISKKLDYTTDNKDIVYITHDDTVDITNDGKRYIRNQHKISLVDYSMFSTGNIFENFNYAYGDIVNSSDISFSTQTRGNSDLDAEQNFTIKLDIQTMEWDVENSCH